MYVCRSDEALLEWIGMLVNSTMAASDAAMLQSIVLIQNFPKLISSNHTREALKALSSLAKDARLVGTGGRRLYSVLELC